MRRAYLATVRVGARFAGFEEEHDVAEELAQAAERGAPLFVLWWFGSYGVCVLRGHRVRGFDVCVFEVVREFFHLGRGARDELRGGRRVSGEREGRRLHNRDTDIS